MKNIDKPWGKWGKAILRTSSFRGLSVRLEMLLAFCEVDKSVVMSKFSSFTTVGHELTSCTVEAV